MQLAQDIRHDLTDREATSEAKTKRDGRVEVGAGYISQGVNQAQDDQAECQGDADMRDAMAGQIVDDDRPGSREHECERAKQFREKLAHRRGFMYGGHLRRQTCCSVILSSVIAGRIASKNREASPG